MDKYFLAALDSVRQLLGMPIVLNSAYRSNEYELTKGRSGTSSHTKGLAVDIRCYNASYAHQLISAILKLYPYARIGVASNYIHFDLDTSKRPAIWTY